MEPSSYKRLLMIAYGFPPMKSMGAFRNYYIASEYSKHFDEVIIITPKNKKHFSNDQSFPLSHLKIHKVPSFDYHTIASLVFKSKESYHENKQKRELVFLKRLNSTFPINLIFGEGGMIYIIWSLLTAIKLIRRTNIQYIHSSYSPFADHLIAFLTKKWFNRLRWIADFRDLQSYHTEKSGFVKIPKKILMKIFNSTEVITTVSDGLKSHLSIYNPPVYVLRNGIFPLKQLKPVSENSIFTINYTGSIYPRLQNADVLFSALNSLIEKGSIKEDEIRLVYRGKDYAIWNKWVTENGLTRIADKYSPEVSLIEAQEIQNAGHINLLLSWSALDRKGVLTGKMYEYMNAGYPVLLIINGNQDEEFENIFNETNMGLVTYTNKRGSLHIEKFILKIFKEWKTTGGVSKVVFQKALDKYKWENMIENFLNTHIKG